LVTLPPGEIDYQRLPFKIMVMALFMPIRLPFITNGNGGGGGNLLAVKLQTL